MVFELDADLPLIGLVPDEGVFQQLLSWGALGVILHQAALNEAEELFRPIKIKFKLGTELRCVFEIQADVYLLRWEILLRKRIKIKNLAHHFLDLSRGGGFLGMRNRALIGCMSHSAGGNKKEVISESQKHTEKSYISD